MSEKTLNNANVRVYGSMFDGIWVAPLGTPDPVIKSKEDLLLDLPKPWVNVGWLNEDGIPLTVSTDIEKMKGHQGGSLLRTKVTSTEKGFSIGALEESPLVTGMFFDHKDPYKVVEGVARVDLPKGIGTVAVKTIQVVNDDDVTKWIVSQRTEIGEREDVDHQNAAISGYTMAASIVGEAYILTDSQSYLDAAKPLAGAVESGA